MEKKRGYEEQKRQEEHKDEKYKVPKRSQQLVINKFEKDFNDVLS